MVRIDHSKKPGDVIFMPRIGMCLDFANTIAWRGSSPAESLHDFAELLEWCVSAGVTPAAVARELRRWLELNPRPAANLFLDAIEIREAIYRIFHRVASGATPAAKDLEILNRGLRAAPPRSALARGAGGYGWTVAGTKAPAASLLAPVLWSAGDLLVAPQLLKVRACANEQCLWLFSDDSKNGTRRWCSMQACGNRAKAHRHYLRQKRA